MLDFVGSGIDKYLIALAVVFVVCLIIEGKQKNTRNKR